MAEYSGADVTLEVLLGAVWTAVAQVVDIGEIGPEAEEVEVSHRDSIWKRFVGGMLDGGEMDFDLIFDPDHASHDPTLTNSMYAYAVARTLAQWRLTFPGVGTATTTATFYGFVRSFKVGSPLDEGIKASCTLRISGAPAWVHVP